MRYNLLKNSYQQTIHLQIIYKRKLEKKVIQK